MVNVPLRCIDGVVVSFLFQNGSGERAVHLVWSSMDGFTRDIESVRAVVLDSGLVRRNVEPGIMG